MHISRTDPFTQPAPLPLASDAVLITSSPTTPTDLAQHNNYLSALTTNLSTENYALIDKIKQLEAEISTLKSDPVIKSPLTIASSTSSPAGSSGEESEFKSKLIKLGGELFDERARCDALIAELEAERNNSVQASRDYVLAMDRLHQMESASEALESQIAQLAAESKASMDHVGVQTGGLVTEEEMQSEVALSSLSEENARLKEQISQLESSVADLQVSAAGATTATTAASAEDGWDVEVDWDVTDHPKEKSAQSESIVSFNQRVMELESYLSEKDSKIVSLTAELEETSIRFQNEFQQSQAQAKAAHEQEVLELSSRLRDALARLENRAELNASTAAALSSENEQQLQREDLLAQLDDVVTQRDDLASKLTHLAQEFGKMRQGYEDASFDARQEKDADLARFEELSSQYQQAIGEIESLRQLSSTVEEHHQQALSEIQSLKEENERVNQQAAFLNNEVKEIRDREAAHSSDVTSLVESFRDLNEQQTANKSEIQRLLEENTQLLFTLEDAKGQMATLKQSHSEEILAALGSAAAAVDSEEVVALKQARDEAVNRLQELYNENNLLQNELHLATEARLRLESDTEKAVATLEASLNAAHSEKEDLLYELESSRQAQEAVQLQLDSSLLERDEISRQFASKVQEMEDQSSQLLEKIAELETQVETLNREMDESRKSLYSDMASSVNLQKEYEQSSQIVDHLTRENTAVTERVALLNASLAEAEQTAARHAQELSDFKAYYEPLVQQLQADAIEKEKQVYEYQQNMEEYIKGIQNELSSCQDQLSDTRNKFETMEAENGKFGETVSELQQRCKLADQQVQEQLVAIAQLELEKQHTSQYLQQQLSQSALEFDEKLRPLEISNQELLITNDVLKNQLSERLASETEISGLKVMVSELEDSLFTERDHLLEAQKKYSSAEEEKNNIVLDLQVAEERITTLNNTVSEVREEMERTGYNFKFIYDLYWIFKNIAAIYYSKLNGFRRQGLSPTGSSRLNYCGSR